MFFSLYAAGSQAALMQAKILRSIQDDMLLLSFVSPATRLLIDGDSRIDAGAVLERHIVIVRTLIGRRDRE